MALDNSRIVRFQSEGIAGKEPDAELVIVRVRSEGIAGTEPEAELDNLKSVRFRLEDTADTVPDALCEYSKDSCSRASIRSIGLQSCDWAVNTAATRQQWAVRSEVVDESPTRSSHDGCRGHGLVGTLFGSRKDKDRMHEN